MIQFIQVIEFIIILITQSTGNGSHAATTEGILKMKGSKWVAGWQRWAAKRVSALEATHGLSGEWKLQW